MDEAARPTRRSCWPSRRTLMHWFTLARCASVRAAPARRRHCCGGPQRYRPQSPEALGNLAAALQALGRHEEAATHYERALALRPDMLDARFGLAACLQACRSPRGGDRLLRDASYRRPRSPGGELRAGNAVGATRPRRRSRREISRRPRRRSGFCRGELRAGQALLLDGDADEEAVRHLLRALDVDPEYIEARVSLGTTLSQLDRDDDGDGANFGRCLRSSLTTPRHTTESVSCSIAGDDYAEAIEHLRRGACAGPGSCRRLGGHGQRDEEHRPP